MKFALYFRECYDLSSKPPVCMALSPFVTSTLPRVMYVSKKSMLLFCFVAYSIFFSLLGVEEERKVTIVLVLGINRVYVSSHTKILPRRAI